MQHLSIGTNLGIFAIEIFSSFEGGNPVVCVRSPGSFFIPVIRTQANQAELLAAAILRELEEMKRDNPNNAGVSK